jgi:hypothetical protein
VPNDCRDLALLMARYHGTIHRAAELKASTIVTLFEKADALRRPERFQQLLDACLCDYTGRLGWEDKAYDSPQHLLARHLLRSTPLKPAKLPLPAATIENSRTHPRGSGERRQAGAK